MTKHVDGFKTVEEIIADSPMIQDRLGLQEDARREHDAKWAAFIVDPRNAKLVRGLGPMIARRLGV